MTMLTNNAIEQKSPLIVELVGLAGAGKTTLSRWLCQRDESIRLAADLALHRKEHRPIFASQLPSLLMLLLRCRRSGRGFTWDEIKAMAYLQAWPQVLRREARQCGTAILLDHGPIFKLATLHAFGPERLKSQGVAPWWQSRFEQWALTLDVVIWLKAPDKVLLERINGRHQRHVVKGKSEQEAVNFLHRYQASYEQIVTQLIACSRPMLLHFDTNQASIEQIGDKVLTACRLNLCES